MHKTTLLLFSLFIALLELQAQTGVLKGKIADADTGAPLASVSLGTVGGTTLTSGKDGSFSLEVQGKTILVINHVGYKTQSFNVSATDTVIEVFMQKNDESLGEVVVIGYGKQQKKDITSAISSISGKELKELPVTSINAALQSRIPGMQVITCFILPLSFLLFNTNDITV